jgi:hypothetical protein
MTAHSDLDKLDALALRLLEASERGEGRRKRCLVSPVDAAQAAAVVSDYAATIRRARDARAARAHLGGESCE